MSQPSATSRGRNKKSGKVTRRVRGPYSLGGCLSCRRRHVKCDQVKPVCLTCRACGIACEGFSTDLRWVGESKGGKGESTPEPSINARRHLYSGKTAAKVASHVKALNLIRDITDSCLEASRESMAAAISASVSSGSVDATLTDIDVRSRRQGGSGVTSPDILIGPFGLFDANIVPTKPAQPDMRAGDQALSKGSSTPYEAFGDEQDASNPAHPQPLLGEGGLPVDLLDTWDGYLGWTDLFGLEFEVAPDGQLPTNGNALLDPFPTVSSVDQNTGSSTVQAPNTAMNYHPTTTDRHEYPLYQTPEIHSLTDLKSPEVLVLLENYSSHLMPHFQSIPSPRKAAWGPMNHELAVYTLAEATYLSKRDIKAANLSNLYSVLSVSAYNLYTKGTRTHRPPDFWLDFAERAFSDAKSNLRISLETETKGPKSAKYKEQLMACQGLMAHAWVIGDWKEARRVHIEAEGLMRLRGLAKRDISRRTRLLHHAYTWTRIVGESSYVLHDYKKFQEAIMSHGPHVSDWGSAGGVLASQQPQQQPPDSGSTTKLDDFLRIGPRLIGLEGEKKDAQAGLQDIHLEDPRISADDDFHFIYGIREHWLSLLSRTTRLANWLDAIEIPGRLANEELRETLLLQARNLEDAVCAFVGSPRTAGDDVKALSKGPSDCLYRCLTAALLIFFYRRIRDVHPLMLQNYVDSVIQGLDEFDAALASHHHPGPGTPWPAFVAGCEAMGEQRRDKLRDWLDRAYDTCGFESYRQAKEHMMEIWSRSDQAPDYGRDAAFRPTWMQISRARGTWTILY